MKQDIIETSTLKFGIVLSFVMALAGWLTYQLSGSEAMLLDGNFSFISVVAGGLAIFISKRKHKKTKTFPFGSYVFEALFVLIKGLLILGVILAAGLQNALKLLQYFRGDTPEPVAIEPIIFYSLFVGVLCFIQYFYYKRKNETIQNQSSILEVETRAALVDGYLSVGIGIVFLVIWLLPANSSLFFLKDIGDAIVVIIMCAVFLNLPLKIIKDSFIEIGGGVLQDNTKTSQAQKIIIEAIPENFNLVNAYILKLGSSHFVLIYLSPKEPTLQMRQISEIENLINNGLKPLFTTINLEIIINK